MSFVKKFFLCFLLNILTIAISYTCEVKVFSEFDQGMQQDDEASSPSESNASSGIYSLSAPFFTSKVVTVLFAGKQIPPMLTIDKFYNERVTLEMKPYIDEPLYWIDILSHALYTYYKSKTCNEKSNYDFEEYAEYLRSFSLEDFSSLAVIDKDDAFAIKQEKRLLAIVLVYVESVLYVQKIVNKKKELEERSWVSRFLSPLLPPEILDEISFIKKPDFYGLKKITQQYLVDLLDTIRIDEHQKKPKELCKKTIHYHEYVNELQKLDYKFLDRLLQFPEDQFDYKKIEENKQFERLICQAGFIKQYELYPERQRLQEAKIASLSLAKMKSGIREDYV